MTAGSTLPVTVVVDAGSGYSRLQQYSGSRPVGSVEPKRIRGPPLASVLRAGTHEEFLEEVKKELDLMFPEELDEKVSVLIGATAGLRSALDDGTVRPCEVSSFATSLSSFFPPSSIYEVTFELITGEGEAVYEHGSAVDAMRGLGVVGEGGTVGLVSSGGMSSQLVYPAAASSSSGGPPVSALSLPTSLKTEGNAKCLALGVREGLRSYEAFMAGCALDKLNKAKGGEAIEDIEPCTFAVIEMLGGLGEKMEIAHKVMPVADAIVRIEEWLNEEFYPAAEAKENDDGYDMTWKDVAKGGLCVQALSLLSLLPQSSSVYLCRTFKAGEGGGETKANWGHGYVVKKMEREREREREREGALEAA